MLAGFPSVLLGALTIALGALIVWGGKTLWDHRSGARPEFMLRRNANGDWTLERTARRTAFEVWMGVGTVSAGDEAQLRGSATHTFMDMRRGDLYQVARDGDSVWFAWIAGNRRRHSPTYYLVDTLLEIPVLVSSYRGKSATTQQ